jgi:hypothetical protein
VKANRRQAAALCALLAGAAAAQQGAGPMPRWITSPPPDDGAAMYFCGISGETAGSEADAKAQAAQDAQRQVSERLGVSVQIQVIQKTSLAVSNDGSDENFGIESAASHFSRARVSLLRPVDWYILASRNGQGQSVYKAYGLFSIPKNEFEKYETEFLAEYISERYAPLVSRAERQEALAPRLADYSAILALLDANPVEKLLARRLEGGANLYAFLREEILKTLRRSASLSSPVFTQQGAPLALAALPRGLERIVGVTCRVTLEGKNGFSGVFDVGERVVIPEAAKLDAGAYTLRYELLWQNAMPGGEGAFKAGTLSFEVAPCVVSVAVEGDDFSASEKQRLAQSLQRGFQKAAPARFASGEAAFTFTIRIGREDGEGREGAADISRYALSVEFSKNGAALEVSDAIRPAQTRRDYILMLAGDFIENKLSAFYERAAATIKAAARF